MFFVSFACFFFVDNNDDGMERRCRLDGVVVVMGVL